MYYVRIAHLYMYLNVDIARVCVYYMPAVRYNATVVVCLCFDTMDCLAFVLHVRRISGMPLQFIRMALICECVRVLTTIKVVNVLNFGRYLAAVTRPATTPRAKFQQQQQQTIC